MKVNLGGLAPSALAALTLGSGGGGQHASPIGQDRVIRKEVSLGLIREIVPPQTHIGLELFPLLPVETDDVIFSYAIGDADGLAPARAEDSESEMAQKDDFALTEGRASVIDWAIKDHYNASDVRRYREFLTILEAMRDQEVLKLTASSATEGWLGKLARDTARRRRKLDNRIEWLIMSALSTGTIGYNDGKIKFGVDFGRPATQQLVLGTHTTIDGNASYPLGAVWTDEDSNPIRDIVSIQEYIYDVYGVRITRAITSRRVLNSILNSSRFAARTGLVVGGNPNTPIDPNYLIDGWGPIAAQKIVEQQTGVVFREYDSVYRTRPINSTTFVNHRFLPQNRIIFLPSEEDIREFDDTEIGFGRVLTSPHPAGDWESGWYEWERVYGVDPWGIDRGNGIKAFPVFPHMQLSFALDVIAA